MQADVMAPSLRSFAFSLVAMATLAGCASSASTQPPASSSPAQISGSGHGEDEAIARVAAIHGGHGPWAVAGYRMGRFALERLGLQPQSFDLEVIHHSPRSVQYSCIADGASAATGASLGKLNLSLQESDAAHVATTYRKKSTGQALTLRPTAAFAERFEGLPRAKLGEAGRSVMSLQDSEIFEEIPAP